MAKLDDLPDELILNVLHRINSDKADQTTLAGFARVAKKYRPVAEEVLYHAPILPIGFYHHGAVMQFLRALIKDPKLANFVHHLVFPVTKRLHNDESECQDQQCVHGLEDLKADIDRLVGFDYKLCTQVEGEKEISIDGKIDGETMPACYFEPSLGGLVLSLLPNLKTLDMQTYQEPFGPDEHGKVPPRITGITVQDWFGAQRSRVRDNAVSGLAGLQHLTCEEITDFDFFRGPNLTSLELKWDTYLGANPIAAPVPAVISTSITSIHFELGIQMLDGRRCIRSEYLHDLLQGLPALQRISVFLSYPERHSHLDFEDRDDLGWDNIIEALKHAAPTLEELFIDVEVPFTDESVSTRARSIGPSLRHHHFDKLKRLRITNEALCSVQMSHRVDSVDSLPLGLETIEIVDPDYRTLVWVDALTVRKREGNHAVLRAVALRQRDFVEAAQVWSDAEEEGIVIIRAILPTH
ncbi:hypothetical protein J4E83_004168 [Alternaria metachromatica]|uniref:uncharacterized protein n=1 Tax=Alternaria metachromatica TaxID=283354 RepID=UPI0020C56351|nr:uncharacterized protein J4E83_004168 [Alternaria metachromatica]KAI4624493.1 hypothetical protein J4E83_004168 [Alternaria metachromatica]